MAAFRYWRIYITANNGDTYTAISELEFRATPGGADITSPSMPCAESSAYQGWGASKAIDGNVGSASACWVTAGGAPPHWVWFDFGDPVEPVELAMWTEVGLPSRGPMAFLVQGSADAYEWTTVASFTGVTGWANSVPKVFGLVNYLISGTARDMLDLPAGGLMVRAHRLDTGAVLGEDISSDGVTPISLGYESVASEAGSFSVAAGQTVRYGADTRWNEITFASAGTFTCNSSTFGGDPAYGTSKTCQLRLEGVPLPKGRYEIPSGAFAGEAYVVCFDDAGAPVLNHKILRTFPVKV